MRSGSLRQSTPAKAIVSDAAKDTSWLTEGPRAGTSRPKPKGMPHVLAIVLDDTGFGHLGCFGSTISTPNIDRLAAEGLRYTRFHVTAMCSPTRASFLTGRNAHRIGMGFVADIPLDHPGYTGRVDSSAATVARLLRDAGWATRAVGKWHLVPRYERSDAGPFSNWPLGLGFERYYGFLQGDTNQYQPNLVEDNHYVEPQPAQPEGYHLTEDLVDRALRDIASVAESAPGKPTFTYLALGAMHAPHHVPREWADRYAGAFDNGWDEWRSQVIANQRSMGLIPEDQPASERPPWVAAWDSLSADERRMHARQQEVFAGFLSHTDHQIGRLLDGLRDRELLDDTVVMLFSDNGASAEGGVEGSVNEHRFTARVRESREDNLKALDDWGGPSTYNHYSWAWAWAGNAPFKLWKRFTWLGGTRTPLIVRHPASTPDPGGIRHQVIHVADLAPTLLELCGIDLPDQVDGIAQMDFDGRSILETMRDEAAGNPRSTQYFELLGSRSIIHDGWKATTDHVPEGLLDEEELLIGSRAFSTDRWHLYRMDNDVAEVIDLADDHPDVVEDLDAVWRTEAERNHVLPLFDSLTARFGALIGPRWPTGQHIRLTPEAGPISDEILPLLFGGFTMTARVSNSPTHGVVMALGDLYGVMSLVLDSGRLVFTLVAPDATTELASPGTIGSDVTELAITCTTGDEGALGLSVDGQVVASIPFSGDIPAAFQHGGAQVRLGRDVGFAVSERYEIPGILDGTVESLTIDASADAVAPMAMLIQAALRAD